MNISELITKMNDFAEQAKDDAVSIAVSKLAARLENREALFEKPLTQNEITLIRPFLEL